MPMKLLFSYRKSLDRIKKQLGLRYWSYDNLIKRSIRLKNELERNQLRDWSTDKSSQKAKKKELMAIEEVIQDRKSHGPMIDQKDLQEYYKQVDDYLNEFYPEFIPKMEAELQYDGKKHFKRAYDVFCIAYRVLVFHHEGSMEDDVLKAICLNEINDFFSGDLDMSYDFLVQYQLIRMIRIYKRNKVIIKIEINK